uniref:Protein TsetseEP domain-containing protein n=1 Tax=Stomoxys calcitrans TaxID=35570 RepID=A0A1I8PGU5_STOCA
MKVSVLISLLGVCFMAFIVHCEPIYQLPSHVSAFAESEVVPHVLPTRVPEYDETEMLPEEPPARVPEFAETEMLVEEPLPPRPRMPQIDETVHEAVNELMDMVGQMIHFMVKIGFEGGQATITASNQLPNNLENPESVENLDSSFDRSPDFDHLLSQDLDSDALPPIQPRSIFNPLWWLLRSIFRTLRGINCTIKAVVKIRDSTELMLANFHKCGAEASKKVEAVVDSAEKVLNISNEIVHINSEVCGNPNYSSEYVDGNYKMTATCFKQLRSKVISLNSQIRTTVNLIRKVSIDAGECVTTTFLEYRKSIINFPSFIKECSKFN